MVVLGEETKEKLKTPLGKVYKNALSVIKMINGKRMISVGDVCTIALLDAGIVPHLSVYDFRFMRNDLGIEGKIKLKTQYPKPKKYSNPAGTVSDTLISDASKLIEAGGAILIEGEEDLTALAFILGARIGDMLVYGQPKAGIVLVEIDEKIKEKARKFLSL